MLSPRKSRIELRFSTNRQGYDSGADIQRRVARTLAAMLPDLESPRILEIGCGTGFLTREPFTKYPDGRFDITDVSAAMVDECARTLARPGASFQVMDGEHPTQVSGPFDLVVSSMAVQWFDSPLAGLDRLASLGPVWYAATGPQMFREWRSTLERLSLPVGLIEQPDWPGLAHEELIEEPHRDALSFLRSLKQTGVSTPRAGHSPLGASQMRRAIKVMNTASNCAATWHIVYGCISR